MRRSCALAVAALLLGSGGAAETSDWLAEGERLTYDLTYLRITSGTLVLEATPMANQTTIRLASRAVSSPFVSRFARVDEQLESILDPCAATTLLSRRQALHDGGLREEVVFFDPQSGTATRFKNGREYEPLWAPPPVLDTLSSLFWLRTLPLAPGGEFRLTVQSGGRVYPLLISVGKVTHLRTTTGTHETLPVVPRFRDGGMLRQKGTLTLWVTNDPLHVPVRIKSELSFGSLTATLRRVERPFFGVVESRGGPQPHEGEADGPETWRTARESAAH